MMFLCDNNIDFYLVRCEPLFYVTNNNTSLRFHGHRKNDVLSGFKSTESLMQRGANFAVLHLTKFVTKSRDAVCLKGKGAGKKPSRKMDFSPLRSFTQQVSISSHLTSLRLRRFFDNLRNCLFWEFVLSHH